MQAISRIGRGTLTFHDGGWDKESGRQEGVQKEDGLPGIEQGGKGGLMIIHDWVSGEYCFGCKRRDLKERKKFWVRQLEAG